MRIELDDALHARIRESADASGRSPEDEVCVLLWSALFRDRTDFMGNDLMSFATSLFGPKYGFDLDLPPRSPDRDRPSIDFTEPEYDWWCLGAPNRGHLLPSSSSQAKRVDAGQAHEPGA